LAASQPIHVTRIVSSRLILHHVAQIACSRFCWNLLLPAPRRSGFILLASAPCHANPVEQIYTRLQLLLADSSLLSLPVGLSLFVPTRAGAMGATATAAVLLLCPPSPTSHLCFSLPFLSLPFPHDATTGARRRQVPGDGAPAGNAPSREGLGGPLPLPHPPCGRLNASSRWGACAPLLDETLGACAAAAVAVKLGD